MRCSAGPPLRRSLLLVGARPAPPPLARPPPPARPPWRAAAASAASPGARVALIHAMHPSIASSLLAFRGLWPEAELVHLMDDSLARDVGRSGLDETMRKRVVALARYAKEAAGCDAVLFTCSAFGEPIEAAQRELRSEAFPVLKPNEAMMAEAAELGGRPREKNRLAPVAVFSIFEPTLPSIARELQEFGGGRLELRPTFIPHALDALLAGDEQGCVRAIAEAAAAAAVEARGAGDELACVVFAMFSMARARGATEELLRQLLGSDAPLVLTSPESAVLQLRRLLGR